MLFTSALRVSLAVVFCFCRLVYRMEAQELGANSSSVDCVNGLMIAAKCQCYSGWTGHNCAQCGGRIRLKESSGFITDNAGTSRSNYSNNISCLFFVQADQPAKSINLKLHLLHLECQWDYLHVFDGDSIYAPKLAAYTGNIVEEPTSSNTFNSTGMDDPDPILDPVHTLHSSGSTLLVYFFSDAASSGPGFSVAYWLDYECPNACSGRGSCNTTLGKCSCPSSWIGPACDLPACPNNCSGNGQCITSSGRCLCQDVYEGIDCSVESAATHWSEVPSPNSSLSVSDLSRASHSAVVYGDYMYIYSGYRFSADAYVNRDSDTSWDNRDEDDNPTLMEGEMLRYGFRSGVWESLNTLASPVNLGVEVRSLEEEFGGDDGGEKMNETKTSLLFPQPRYGHSAVVYNDSMFVFGGSLSPSEEFSNELWLLNLISLQWSPLFPPSNFATTSNSTTSSSSDYVLPLAVRGHTAHVVDSKMIVLFGLGLVADIYLSSVQEYDFTTGEWSLPPQLGMKVNGRVGHASSYSDIDDLIYVYGGRNGLLLNQLLSYDPSSYTWTNLLPSDNRYLHSTTFLGPLLLSFGGCQDKQDCFSSDLLVYHTLCGTWQKLDTPGLPANASRFAHSSVLDPVDGSLLVFGGFVGTLRADMLRLVSSNCSRWINQEDCLRIAGPLCAWRKQEGKCVAISKADGEDVTYSCPIDFCLSLRSCVECFSSTFNCTWNSTSSSCVSVEEVVAGNVDVLKASFCPSTPSIQCTDFKDCHLCRLHGCRWGISMDNSQDEGSCYLETAPSDMTEVTDCIYSSCFLHSGCQQCLNDSGCLWCPSLSRCVPSVRLTYPTTFNFGQCLGWIKSKEICDRTQCEDQTSCSSCQLLPHCGWCNDPSDSGLGVCTPGGFVGPLGNNSSCLVEGQKGEQVEGEWQFDVCSSCQCNGHSFCSNGSSKCDACQNRTTGKTCESCELEYFGNALNGGICNVCDCNGYNTECNVKSGVCQCQDQGVDGDFCTNCTKDYNNGNANNFCYALLSIGYIYTFEVDDPFVDRAFYAVTPAQDNSLHFKFELTRSTPVFIELYLGRKTEDLWVLFRLIESTKIDTSQPFEKEFDAFTFSNESSSKFPLSTFVNPSISTTPDFIQLFEKAVGNQYTSNMWDNDVTLVVYVTSLTNSSSYKITVDQQNYIFLLYFFATFITCFSLLLTVFLVVWYIKKKIVHRTFMRQQYIELQRRVARPFARILLLIENQPASRVLGESKEPNPSYLAVETCKNDKAAVLTMFVRLPGEHQTGLPSLGRTALCLGSTVVLVNSKKKPKRVARQRREEEEEEWKQRGRRVSSSDTTFLVHTTGRSRQQVQTPSAMTV